MLILLGSLIGSIISFIIGEQMAKRISRKNFTVMARNYLKTKKDLMLERILADYKIDDDLLFFKNLYDDDLIDSNKRAKIESFLASENKTITDYLSLLNKNELDILTEPYKQKFAFEIKAKIDKYFVKKDKEYAQILEFHKKGKEFFYPDLSKNLANLQ